ncbi:hypothetical protein PT276_02975 [Orbaceae bacterium ESL0721]|nr:hypothetical protein [Orbaceae bacterium ESL0721]
MESEFFYRPLWQQYLLMVSTVVIFLLVGYLFFIKERQDVARQYQVSYHQNQVALTELQSRLILSNRSDRAPVKMISDQLMAKLYSEHQLQLQTLASNETETVTNWQLAGDYHNFLALLSRLISERYYFDLRHLLIEKGEGEILLFTFTVAIKNSQSAK